jgi:hypothetical protein
MEDPKGMRGAPARRNTYGRSGWGSALLSVLLLLAAGVTINGTGLASAAPQAAAGIAPVVSMTPASLINNEQVVRVNWSGFSPTKTDRRSTQPDDEVGIYECSATTPDGIYYYNRDCYTQLPPNASPISSDGNMLDPTGGQFHGFTTGGGSGQSGFQILDGTLHTDLRFGRPVFNIQCDNTHPCVLKVVDFGQYFKTQTIPNPVGFNQTGDWSDLVGQAPSVPISFAPIPACSSPAPSTPQLGIQGAPSSSYAVEAWAAGLCTSATPVAVNYARTGEATARSALQAGAADIALAAISPTSGPGGGPYVAAPVDVSGVAIAFNMIDPSTGAPITTLRLTPRLVAMLVTDSAINGVSYPAAAYHDALTGDPEFVALNPGFHFPTDPLTPSNLGVIEPILEGYQGDDTSIITQWIADDADAQAFLAGHDVCGAALNANWAGVSYPTSIFQDLERNSPFGAWSGYYNPITNLATQVADLFFGKGAGFNAVGPDGIAAPMPPVNLAQDALFAEFDAASAIRSSEPSASLIPASSTSMIANYVTVTGAGSCQPKPLTLFPGFAAPDSGGLTLGLGAMTVNKDGTLTSPVTTTLPGAYPLTKVDYAFAPASDPSPTSGKAIAAFILYASGTGQAPGILPFGYTPLPSFLQAQDVAAAATVLKGITVPLPPPPKRPAGSPTSAHPPTSAPPTVIPVVGGSPVGTSTSTEPQAAVAATRSTATPSVPEGRAPPRPRPNAPPPAIQAIQAPVTIAAVERTGAWLLPLLAGLALAFGVAGAVLRWGFLPMRRRERKA